MQLAKANIAKTAKHKFLISVEFRDLVALSQNIGALVGAMARYEVSQFFCDLFSILFLGAAFGEKRDCI